MNNEEAIKYLIAPVATSTNPSAEYLKQKEAYELAIEALEERPQGEWELHGMIYYCSNCGHYCGESGDNFCGNCGADMRKGGAK